MLIHLCIKHSSDIPAEPLNVKNLNYAKFYIHKIVYIYIYIERRERERIERRERER